MSLEDIYSRQVKGKEAGGVPTFGTQAPPIFERDPNLKKFEQDVFARMHEIVNPETLEQEPQSGFVSFESAIKELAQMNK